jgi:hypothetical protein
MKKLILLIVFSALFYSCEKPCEEASIGSPGLRIEIVNATTNENVFTNGTYTQNQVQVTTANSTSQEYSFISENNLNVIALSPAWTEGTFTTTIKLNNVVTILIVTKIYKSSSRCFENYFIENVSVTGYSYSQDLSTGILKIKI